MKLSDVMSHSGLTAYAEIGLVLFMIAFVAIVVRVIRMPKREVDHVARLPLDDEKTTDQRKGDEP